MVHAYWISVFTVHRSPFSRKYARNFKMLFVLPLTLKQRRLSSQLDEEWTIVMYLYFTLVARLFALSLSLSLSFFFLRSVAFPLCVHLSVVLAFEMRSFCFYSCHNWKKWSWSAETLRRFVSWIILWCERSVIVVAVARKEKMMRISLLCVTKETKTHQEPTDNTQFSRCFEQPTLLPTHHISLHRCFVCRLETCYLWTEYDSSSHRRYTFSGFNCARLKFHLHFFRLCVCVCFSFLHYFFFSIFLRLFSPLVHHLVFHRSWWIVVALFRSNVHDAIASSRSTSSDRSVWTTWAWWRVPAII